VSDCQAAIAALCRLRVARRGGQVIAPYKNRNPGSDDEGEYVENLFNALCCTLMSPATRAVFVEAEGVELMALILKQKRAARAGALKTLVRAPPGPSARSAAACSAACAARASSPARGQRERPDCPRAPLAALCASAGPPCRRPRPRVRRAQDFALTRNPAACERFVDHLGLKTLFSIFMGKSKARPSKSAG